MKTFLRYITLLLAGGVIIPLCCLTPVSKLGIYAGVFNFDGNNTSVTYMVAAKILPVLHFFKKTV